MTATSVQDDEKPSECDSREEKEYSTGGAHMIKVATAGGVPMSTSKGTVNTKRLRLEDHVIENVPESYCSNSKKELLCLEYVSNFCKEYRRLFPDRRELFICPVNERNVPKFVSTTVRSTLLPYRDLYDVKECANFIANVIEYEPLEVATEPPSFLPSPSTVLSWESGDSFDISNLLASFLIGSGYDAYVVYGYAPKWICLLDQRRANCPYLDETKIDPPQKDEVVQEEENTSAYQISEGHIIKSRYAAMQEEKERERNERAQEIDDLDFEDEEESDPLDGKRVHAWVFVRAGKRDVQSHFFVEASTGTIYPIDDSPYQGIECIWNNQNYFVNMQTDSVHKYAYDLTNSDDWEYVFVKDRDRSAMQTAEDGEGELDGLSEAADAKDAEPETKDNLLDLPPSWVMLLNVEHDMYKRQFCSGGENTTLYRKAVLEQFAENSHDQGLVLRLTIFKNFARTIPKEVREFFKNRRDKLEYRIRYPMEGKFHEHFLPGRPEALKDRIEWIGGRRELYFYTGARIDGLKRREELIRKKTMDTFEGRDDCLIYRSVTLSQELDAIGAKASYTIPNGSHGEFLIHKMTEKFSQDENLLAKETPQKRTYYVRGGTIRVIYHYADGHITSGSRVYHKTATGTKVDIVDVDPQAKRPKESILEDDFQKVLQLEKDCYSNVRHSELETHELLRNRKTDESSIKLEKSIFDAARENASDEKAMDKKVEEVKEIDEQQSDYLTPFLPHSRTLARDEAIKARDSCLKALKERLLERANIIQGRLDEENSQLAKKQAAFQRSQRDHDQGTDEEFEKFCSDAMFRISILEQRLTRHEETALQKYADLDQKLHNDSRLEAAYN